MAKRGNLPTKAELAKIAAGLKPGKRVKVFNGITMTVDSGGRQRFQIRVRVAGARSRQAAQTFDSISEAERGLQAALLAKSETKLQRLERGRKTGLEAFAEDVWLVEVKENLEGLTELWYRSTWRRSIQPYFKGLSFGDLAEFDNWDDYERWLKKRHVKKDGSLAETAVERGYEILNRILERAVSKRVIIHNPLKEVLNERRAINGAARRKAAKKESGARAISRSEIPTPLQVERIRLAMPGAFPLLRQQRRLMITLAAWAGLRPGELLYLRWFHLLDLSGLLSYVAVRGAVKDIAGRLVEGDTKTHTERDFPMFQFMAEEIWALYQAAGCPPLETLVFPNRQGKLLRWGNVRDDVWYPALHRAGIAAKPEATAIGAFDPYCMRHHCASLLMHAVNESGNRYSQPSIANWMGHTVGVLLGTYTHVIDDDVLGAGGRTIQEIAMSARRTVWGPLPGDRDFVDETLKTTQVSEMTGLSISQVGGRCARGTLPATKVGGEYRISSWELRESGLLVKRR